MAAVEQAQVTEKAADEVVNTVVDAETSVAPKRYFTVPGIDPFDAVEWELRDAHIPGRDGPTFEQKDVEFPKFWSQTATNIVAQKYFRGRMASPERERSVKQMIGRVVDTISGWGREGGYFATDEEAETFEAELKAILVNQYASFNSPVWFNVGFEAQPQCSACFILSIDDSMESILDWIRREGIIFRGGSGSGLNLSRLRSSKEQLSKGGYASGPVSFMRGADASAGTIKSGGKTRRAAKMVVLDVEHPDVEEFIWCKAKEERKARVLESAGYDMSLNSPDWASIQYQNANNSVRVTDQFMESVIEGKEWNLTARTDGSVVETTDARGLLRQMAEAAWECADPGVQYDTTINSWHTLPNTGRINASNPCSEYMSIDDSACNLASLHRQVAFRVHAHRTPREICRPDPDQFIVDNHHLRVHERGHGLRARRRWIDDAQPLVRVSGDQVPEDAVAKGAHGALLEPAVAFLRRDDQHLGAIRLTQSRRESGPQDVIGEVLAFDVDRPFRRRDRIQKQRFTLPDGRLRLGRRLRPRDGNIDIREVGSHVGGPEVVGGCPELRHRVFAERTPAVAGQHPETGRNRARHHRLDFVIRRVGLARGCRPRRLLDSMSGRVPAMARQIDAAAERQLVVHDDDFLMVGAAYGMAVVETESDVSRHSPSEPPS